MLTYSPRRFRPWLIALVVLSANVEAMAQAPADETVPTF
jgi:hypothetical protein